MEMIIPSLNIFIIIIFAFISLALFAFWLIALIHSLTSKERPEYKLLWSFVIIVFNIIGAVLYFILNNYSKKATDTKKRLTKSSKDRILFGVCGGLAKYFGVDSNLLRVVFILLLFVTAGNVLIFYILAAILIPTERALEKTAMEEKKLSGSQKKSENKIAKTSKLKANKKVKSTKKRKGVWVYILLALFIVFVIVTIIGSAIIAGFVLYYSYESTSHETVFHEIEVEQKAISEMVAKEIMQHPLYRQNNGYDLLFLESKQTDQCTGQRHDGSLIVASENNCREFTHRFFFEEKDGIDGYLVDTLVFREEIIGMEFKEFEKESPSQV